MAYARIQGKTSLIGHFQNSSLLCEDKKCRPLLFQSEGPSKGEPQPFPAHPHPRPHRRGGGSQQENNGASNSQVDTKPEKSGRGRRSGNKGSKGGGGHSGGSNGAHSKSAQAPSTGRTRPVEALR